MVFLPIWTPPPCSISSLSNKRCGYSPLLSHHTDIHTDIHASTVAVMPLAVYTVTGISNNNNKNMTKSNFTFKVCLHLTKCILSTAQRTYNNRETITTLRNQNKWEIAEVVQNNFWLTKKQNKYEMKMRWDKKTNPPSSKKLVQCHQILFLLTFNDPVYRQLGTVGAICKSTITTSPDLATDHQHMHTFICYGHTSWHNTENWF